MQTISDKQHVNLFRQEQIDQMIKQKQQERTGEVEIKDEFLKKTGLLGDLMRDKQRPWYAKSVAPDELKQSSDIINNSNEDKEDKGFQKFIVREQLKQFKNQKEDFCQVLET